MEVFFSYICLMCICCIFFFVFYFLFFCFFVLFLRTKQREVYPKQVQKENIRKSCGLEPYNSIDIIQSFFFFFFFFSNRNIMGSNITTSNHRCIKKIKKEVEHHYHNYLRMIIKWKSKQKLHFQIIRSLQYYYLRGFPYLESSIFLLKNALIPLYLSRDKIKGQLGKNTTLTPTKTLHKKLGHSPINF